MTITPTGNPGPPAGAGFFCFSPAKATGAAGSSGAEAEDDGGVLGSSESWGAGCTAIGCAGAGVCPAGVAGACGPGVGLVGADTSITGLDGCVGCIELLRFNCIMNPLICSLIYHAQ